MVEQKPSKLMTRVRFPSPAPTFAPSALRSASRACAGLNRSGLVTDFSDGRRGLALASTKGHEKFSRGATAPPRSVAQWLEHRSPKPGVGGSSPSTPANNLKDLWQPAGERKRHLDPSWTHSAFTPQEYPSIACQLSRPRLCRPCGCAWHRFAAASQDHGRSGRRQHARARQRQAAASRDCP